MHVMYARVDERVHERVTAISKETGLSVSVVTNELLLRALELTPAPALSATEIVTQAVQGGKQAA